MEGQWIPTEPQSDGIAFISAPEGTARVFAFAENKKHWRRKRNGDGYRRGPTLRPYRFYARTGESCTRPLPPDGNEKHWHGKRSGEKYCAYDGIILQRRIDPLVCRRSMSGNGARHSASIVFTSAPTETRTHLLPPPTTESIGAENGAEKLLRLRWNYITEANCSFGMSPRHIRLMGNLTLRPYHFYASVGENRTHLLHPPETENTGAESGAAMDTRGALHSASIVFMPDPAAAARVSCSCRKRKTMTRKSVRDGTRHSADIVFMSHRR